MLEGETGRKHVLGFGSLLYLRYAENSPGTLCVGGERQEDQEFNFIAS